MEIIKAHQTEIALGLAWLYSAVMSSMPPVDETKISFPARWALRFAQFIAANVHKV